VQAFLYLVYYQSDSFFSVCQSPDDCCIACFFFVPLPQQNLKQAENYGKRKVNLQDAEGHPQADSRRQQHSV
jgi:hypothetical protein